jgi:hypothetical protein
LKELAQDGPESLQNLDMLGCWLMDSLASYAVSVRRPFYNDEVEKQAVKSLELAKSSGSRTDGLIASSILPHYEEHTVTELRTRPAMTAMM